MTIIAPITKRLEYNANGHKYTALKYVCPICDGVHLGIQRGYRHIARCRCDSCGHKWTMYLHETTARVQLDIKEYWKANGLRYRLTYDNSAPFEQQLPF